MTLLCRRFAAMRAPPARLDACVISIITRSTDSPLQQERLVPPQPWLKDALQSEAEYFWQIWRAISAYKPTYPDRWQQRLCPNSFLCSSARKVAWCRLASPKTINIARARVMCSRYLVITQTNPALDECALPVAGRASQVNFITATKVRAGRFTYRRA